MLLEQRIDFYQDKILSLYNYKNIPYYIMLLLLIKVIIFIFN